MPQFTATQLNEVKLKLPAMWADAQVESQYKAEVTALTAIRSNQTARLEALTTPNVNNTVSINWITTNLLAVKAGGPNCELEGANLDATKKVYALDTRRAIDFQVNEEDLKSNIFSMQEVVGRGLLAALKLLDEDVARISVAKADAYAGSNVYTAGFTQSNGKTVLPVTQTAQERYAYLAKMRLLNRMRDSYIIDNGETFEEYQIARFNSGNGEGKGTQAAFDSMNIYFDLFNMAAAGLTTDTLVIQRGALAFASKANFSSVPQELGGEVNQTRYKISSPNLPGVEYDVYYTMKCVVNATTQRDEIVHIWRIVAEFGLFLNPTAPGTQTGIVAFIHADA